MTPRPPRLASWLVRWSVPPADQDAVLGDFDEEFRARTVHDGTRAARRWYWRQAGRSVPYHLRRRLDAVGPFPWTGMWPPAWLDGVRQDLNHGVRSLRATPGFTIVALTVLALGIGSATAIYSVVDGVVLRGLSYPRDAQLVLVGEPNITSGRGRGATMPEFRDWRSLQTSFTDLGASRGAGANVFARRDGDTAESLRVNFISASLLSTLDVSPALGRAFTTDDEIPGNEHTLLLSDSYWRRHFSARRDVVGQTMTFESGTWTIIGVMPPSFMYPPAMTTPMDMWAPLAPMPAELARDGTPNFNLTVIGRLKPGVTLDRAQADLARVTAGLKQASPEWFGKHGVKVTSLRDSIVGSVRSWMLLLLGAVAFVLLLACVNVANLLLVRATTRARDSAVRAALGASRWRILRGLLIESLVLSALGTALGVALAVWGVDVLRGTLPSNLPRLAAVAVNYRVAGIAACVAIAVAIGVTPIWQASPTTSRLALRDAGRSGVVGAGRSHARGVLLASEMALAVMLLVGSGLFVSSFVRLLRVDLGFETSNVLQVDLSPRGNHTDAALTRLRTTVMSIMNAVQRVPGVEKLALVSGTPPLVLGDDRTAITVSGRPAFKDYDDAADEKLVTSDYFDVLHVPVLHGRTFVDDDARQGAPPVVILNDIASATYFGQDNPVGAMLSIGSSNGWTVVGVVRAVRLQGPESDPRPEIYTPLNWQTFRGNPLLMLVVRTSSDPAALGAAVKDAIHTAAPALVMPDIETYDELFGGLVAQRKFNMLVFVLFGCLAVAIAGTGIFGVMAYVVEQRTQEIGVRMALGAEPARVVRMVLAATARTMGVGLVVGLVGAWMLARFVQAFLFKGNAHDPIVYIGAGAMLVLAGVVAAFVPAKRASEVDPLVALRTQ